MVIFTLIFRTRSTINNVLFILVGVAIYLPYQAILIPLVQIITRTGLALTLASPQTTTIQINLAELKGSFMAAYHTQMAVAVITPLVSLVIFLALGNYFIKGTLAGALKG